MCTWALPWCGAASPRWYAAGSLRPGPERITGSGITGSREDDFALGPAHPAGRGARPDSLASSGDAPILWRDRPASEDHLRAAAFGRAAPLASSAQVGEAHRAGAACPDGGRVFTDRGGRLVRALVVAALLRVSCGSEPCFAECCAAGLSVLRGEAAGWRAARGRR